MFNQARDQGVARCPTADMHIIFGGLASSTNTAFEPAVTF